MVSRSVIVTGGFGGIDFAVARAFRRRGSIALLDAREDRSGACET
jgi:NAD(P)-dependent dehydrogenase (short-subunit alcohol dehydrogenase family)